MKLYNTLQLHNTTDLKVNKSKENEMKTKALNRMAKTLNQDTNTIRLINYLEITYTYTGCQKMKID